MIRYRIPKLSCSGAAEDFFHYLVQHKVSELLRQRIGALALGYEDLNDHDRLRHDPLHALMAGKADVLGEDRLCQEDKGKALAAHSTLNCRASSSNRCRTGISCSASPRCSARTSATTAICSKTSAASPTSANRVSAHEPGPARRRPRHRYGHSHLRRVFGLPPPPARAGGRRAVCAFGGLPRHARDRSQALGGSSGHG